MDKQRLYTSVTGCTECSAHLAKWVANTTNMPVHQKFWETTES